VFRLLDIFIFVSPPCALASQSQFVDPVLFYSAAMSPMGLIYGFTIVFDCLADPAHHEGSNRRSD
jgi:hypothetical protein